MEVAGEQGGANLPLEIIDPAANNIDGQVEPFSRGPEAPATDNLQENPGRVPIRETAESELLVFL